MTKNVTQMLHRLVDGDSAATDALFNVVYEELRRLASACFRQERRDHTLQPTALVHEAYLKLIRQDGVQWSGRAHFFAIAARAMRQILINHAVARKAAKRSGNRQRTPLSQVIVASDSRAVDLIALDEALQRLTDRDERASRIVELRFFGGLTNQEVAEVLNVSLRTVEGEWAVAKAWLLRELKGDDCDRGELAGS